jgi:hypothetical protein
VALPPGRQWKGPRRRQPRHDKEDP